MKRLLFLVMVAGLVAFLANEPVNKLNGAFRQVRYKYGSMTNWSARDSVTVIKVFRDGYWLAAFYDDKRRGHYDGKTSDESFNGACGGTYELKDGKYVEKVNFYSWDSTAVGNEFVFDYKVSPRQYEQFGVITSDKYKNFPINEVAERFTATEPLKHPGLEGVWFMQAATWGGNSHFSEGKYKGVQVIKIFNYPLVVYAYYNPTTRQFDGAGGARYQFDGKTLTETNEFWSWQANGARKGKVETFRITVKDGQYVQEGWSGGLREVWGKAPASSSVALKN